MKDIKSVVAKNLSQLRRARGLTQAELAEKFNYSDKAVCRWESGDTLPDINVLYALASFYGITMNDLTSDSLEVTDRKRERRNARAYMIWMCLLISSTVWVAATMVFVFTLAFRENAYWLVFISAVPITCIVVFRTLRSLLGTAMKIIVSSLTSWSLIAAVYLHILFMAGLNFWHIFIIGLSVQGLLIYYFMMKRYKDRL
ncbi:MAG: helix-turn-helix domain-containing protein [Clostridia bacterium]|nr:helix-turn-helix domain-containing protein [Clostridia bacterium]